MEDGAGDRRCILFNVCASFEHVVGWKTKTRWAKALLENGRSSRGREVSTVLWSCLSPACVFLVRLGLVWLGLACLLAPAAVVHECLWSGGVGWGWVEVAGRAVLGDTAVHLPERTLGASHTPDDDLA